VTVLSSPPITVVILDVILRLSILPPKVKGRLGNQMLAYSLVSGVKREFGIRSFLEEVTLKNLQFYFPNANKVYYLQLTNNNHAD
jgi:hypothetical protein